jgi:hypothetical protein
MKRNMRISASFTGRAAQHMTEDQKRTIIKTIEPNANRILEDVLHIVKDHAQRMEQIDKLPPEVVLSVIVSGLTNSIVKTMVGAIPDAAEVVEAARGWADSAVSAVIIALADRIVDETGIQDGRAKPEAPPHATH